MNKIYFYYSKVKQKKKQSIFYLLHSHNHHLYFLFPCTRVIFHMTDCTGGDITPSFT